MDIDLDGFDDVLAELTDLQKTCRGAARGSPGSSVRHPASKADIDSLANTVAALASLVRDKLAELAADAGRGKDGGR